MSHDVGLHNYQTPWFVTEQTDYNIYKNLQKMFGDYAIIGPM